LRLSSVASSSVRSAMRLSAILAFRRCNTGWASRARPSPLSTGPIGPPTLAAGVGRAHQGRMATLIADRPPAEAAMGRALPANLEAEAAFLGAVLIDNRLLEDLVVPIRAEHFFEPLHARIFERIALLIDRQMVVT